jgi:hypothetical protein
MRCIQPEMSFSIELFFDQKNIQGYEITSHGGSIQELVAIRGHDSIEEI